MATGTTDKSKVTVGSGRVTGAIFVAPLAAALPTDAATPLPEDYKCVGFTSDDGTTQTASDDTQDLNAYEGRAKVRTLITSHTEQMQFKPIECNEVVAKLTWGEDNVETTSTGELHITHKADTLPAVHVVHETVPTDDSVHRYCGTMQLTERGDATLDGTQSDQRQVTLDAIPDDDGVYMHEYVAFNVKPSAGTGNTKATA